MSQPLLAATPATGPSGALAAAERMQHLQALIARVEEGPAGFAAALRAAQGSPASGPAGTGLAQAGTGLPQAGTGLAQAGTGLAQATPGIAQMGPGATPAALGAATLTDATSTGPGVVYPAVLQSAAANGTPTTVLGNPGAVPGASAGGPGPYDSMIAQAAARNGVDPAVLHGLIQQESGFDPNARSGAGALGLTQLMPGTASSLGVTEPLNPEQSIEGGARYLGQMLRQFGGDTAAALAAYNAGPGAVQRYGGVPPYPETQQYVTKVMGYAAAYRQSAPAAGVLAASSPSGYGATQAAIA